MRPTWSLRPSIAAFLVAGTVLARAATAAEPAGNSPPRDPANVAGLSQAMEAMADGNDKLVGRDAVGAIASYRRAIKLQPRNPLPHLLLGQALVASNALPEAEAAFNDGESVAEGSAAIKARLLFSLADIKERQNKLEDAKAAWLRYADHAKQKDAHAFPQTAAARIAAIDEVTRQEKASELVRQRIADEKK